jgi:hypothetical protein
LGFSVTRRFDQGAAEHVVTVKIGLTMAETSGLFLSGDTIISWPEGDLRASGDTGSAGLEHLDERTLTRTGMFVSELARLAHGLEIGYRQPAEAERAAQLVRLQLVRAGIEEGI